MSFFDVPIPPPPPRPKVERPPWDGPPRGVLPGHSAQRAVLFRTGDGLLLVHRFLAYPNGIEATLSLFVRGDAAPRVGEIPWELHGHPGDGSLPDEFLRFGVLFSDGSKWTNLNWGYPAMGEEPSGPLLLGRGGHGGQDDWEIRYWLWPLPPPGKLTFFTSWPLLGIPEQHAEVDADEIRARAEDAETIWEA